MKIWSTGTAVLIKSLEDCEQNKRQKVAFRRPEGIAATLYAWEDGTAQAHSDHVSGCAEGSSLEEQHFANMSKAMEHLDSLYP